MCTPFRLGLLVAGLLLITSNVEAQQDTSTRLRLGTGTVEIEGTQPGPAAASAPPPPSYWLVLNLNSLHADRETPYNERNYGLGLEKVINNILSIEAGYYRNSLYRTTKYLSLSWKPLGDEQIKAGLAFSCLSGYLKDGKVACVPLPVVSYETRYLAVEAIVTPEVLGFRTKWRY